MGQPVTTHTTQSGRAVCPPRWLIDDIGATTMNQLAQPECHYYEQLTEFGCAELVLVGAGVGGGFENTQELHIVKYNEAMKTADKNKWEKEVEEEHECMVKCKLWKLSKG
jgi:hypothetical protein